MDEARAAHDGSDGYARASNPNELRHLTDFLANRKVEVCLSREPLKIRNADYF